MDVTLSSCAWGSSAFGVQGNAATLGLLVNNTSNLTAGQFIPNPNAYGGITMTLSLDRTTGIMTIQNLNAGLMAYLSAAGLNASNTPLYFTIAALDASVLPLKLISFTANIVDDKYANITWDVASEMNMQSYTIQRSDDGVKWTNLQTVLPINNIANVVQHYSENDESPISGISFYRLRMIDYSGNISYSNIQKVEVNAIQFNINKITPNPFHSNILIDISLPDERNISVSLIDAYGRIIKGVIVNGKKGQNTVTINNLNGFLSGLYIVKAGYSKNSIIKKVLKTE